MLFETILYPTDFSDVSKKALSVIKQFAKYKVKKVIILHVVHQRIIDSLSIHAGRINIEEFKEDLINNAKNQLAEIKNELHILGLSVVTRIKIGIPMSEILKAEAEENPTVIVLGSHGKTNLQEMLMGSVSEKVIRQSKKPVLVIKR